MLARVLLASMVVLSAALLADDKSLDCPDGTSPNAESTPEIIEAWCELMHNGVTVMHGPYKAWWPNGALSVSGNYDYGKPVGKWTGWYMDGKIQGEDWFEDGKLVRERRSCTLSERIYTRNSCLVAL